MKTGLPILVIGGTGRTGRLIVARVLERALRARVLTRRQQGARGQLGPGVEVVAGDITQPRSVQEAAVGVGGLVIIVESAEADDAPNSPERVHYQGVQNVIAAAARGTHVVLVTQIYITRPERYPEVANIIRWRERAEEALRDSGLPYTVVRPAWLIDGPVGGVHLEQGDNGDGKVSRAAVAEVCVQALLHPEARGKSFEVYRGDRGVDDWRAAFATLQMDSRQEKR